MLFLEKMYGDERKNVLDFIDYREYCWFYDIYVLMIEIFVRKIEWKMYIMIV